MTQPPQGVELAVSDRDYTMTYNLEDEATRLFDRSSDPAHTKDLSGSQAERSRSLRQEIDRQLELAAAGSPDAAAERARRLEDELRALGYLVEPSARSRVELDPSP